MRGTRRGVRSDESFELRCGGRKAVTKLDSILKSRDTTLPTKGCERVNS